MSKQLRVTDMLHKKRRTGKVADERPTKKAKGPDVPPTYNWVSFTLLHKALPSTQMSGEDAKSYEFR